MTDSDVTEKPTFELMVCGWDKNPRHCVYLNDYRIAGGKPWGGAQTESHWYITLDDLCAAIPELRAMREALRFGFYLYGLDGPDGPWPMDKRREFDRLARLGLGLSGAQPDDR